MSDKIFNDLLKKYCDALIELRQLKNNTEISQVVDLILKKQGKLIFSGIGKSAHICKKSAATFSSLGISSFFIHATEASHGDLGMIDENDILFFVSNSGETSEMKDIVCFAKKNKILSVGISKNSESFLAKNVNFFIQLSMPELLDDILAPTISTTCTLVLLDLIACSVAKKQSFTVHDYGRLHPGGNLGEVARNIKK